jgi:hypothetical protein
MKGPFKLRSGNTTPFKMMGSSPLKHPHRTWKEANSHDKDQPHPKSEITEETVVDNSGKVADNPKKNPPQPEQPTGFTEKKAGPPKPPSNKKQQEEEEEEVIQLPPPGTKPPGWGLDR